MDDAFFDKLQSTIRRWEDENDPPDVVSGAAPDSDSGAGPLKDMSEDAPGEMVLPEMDLTEPIRQRAAAPPVEAPSRGEVGSRPALSRGSDLAAKSSGPDWKGIADRLSMASAGRGLSKGFEGLFANVGARSGYRPNAHAGDVLTETAQQPLELAKERQGYESRDLAMKGQKAAIGVKAAMDDPNSLQSQKARESVKNMGLRLPSGFDGWSANDVHNFARTGELVRLEHDRAAEVERKAKEQAALERKAFEDQRHEDERAENNRYRDQAHEDSMANAEATRALTAQGQSRLPAGEASKLGGSDAAIKSLDDLSSEWDEKASATGSGVMQFFPGSPANTYLPSLRGTTQTVGTYLEGGKLTDADVPKYAAMMPQAQDTAAQKAAKISAVKRLIATKRAEEAKALQGSGYRVPETDIAPKRPAGVPEGAVFMDGKYIWEESDGTTRVVEAPHAR